MRKILTLISLLFAAATVAQDSSRIPSKWSFNGYVSDLETLQFDKINNNNTSGHLLHNRINIKWKPTDKINVAGECRNRFFYGEAGSENQKPVFKSEIERLYTDITKDKWNIRIGRQRINWSMGIIWNPNDMFNAYNFLDVDYDERPGTDALQFQYHPNDFSHIELVHSGLDINQITAAKYFLNTNGYDFQFIGGVFKGEPTVGAGWAGNIKEAGFKGELQYYFGHADSKSQINLTIGVDYMFRKGWYLNTGFLYNSAGLNQQIEDGQYLNLRLSAKNLMPTKYNGLLMIQKQINPLSAISLTTIYSPGVDLLILMPSLSYNLLTNLDANFIWQSFYFSRHDRMQSFSDMGFLRLRWNF